MADFNNRISAQRTVLQAVNAVPWPVEPLFSLASSAIERWVIANRLDATSKLVALIVQASASLFFLANKSQEQVSDDYRAISRNVAVLTDEIKIEMGRRA